jgi:hypothetical protein
MSAFLDSSVLVAALAPDETKHADCLALLLQGGHCIYSHALLETFSTLTGAKHDFSSRTQQSRFIDVRRLLGRVDCFRCEMKSLTTMRHMLN